MFAVSLTIYLWPDRQQISDIKFQCLGTCEILQKIFC